MSRFVFIALLFYILAGNAVAVQFDHLTIEDGLSSNHVYCIFQDSTGYMWFGTNRGLNRWDGVDVHLFEHDPDDSTTLTSNDIRTIMEDESHVMWVGTYNGLNRFDRRTETFSRYYFCRNDTCSTYIKTILDDGDSLLWLGTNFGLIRFHKNTGEFEQFVHLNEKGKPHIWRNYIYKLNWLKDGRIIVGTLDDFITFDPRTEKYGKVHSRLEEKKWAGGFWSCVDKNERVWMGMSGYGLFCYDQKKDILNSYLYTEGTLDGYFPCTACILQDHNGVLWFATLGGGLYRYIEESRQFVQYIPRIGDDRSISSSVTCFLYEDRQGNLWIGTYDGGANKIPRWSKNIRFHRRHENPEESIGDGDVSALCEDRDGVLWAISGGSGARWIYPDFWTASTVEWGSPEYRGNLWLQTIDLDSEGNIWVAPPILKYDWKNKTTSLEVPPEVNGKRTYNGAIRTICQDSSGNMWFGTTYGGLLKLDKNYQTKVYIHSPTDSTSLPRNQIPDILCDSEGVLWIGTMNGLSRLLPGEDKFTNYYATGNSGGNDSNAVVAIIEDSVNQIWLCSPFSLYRFDRETFTFENKMLPLATQDSGPLAILEDHNHHLWLRTFSGMIWYNPQTDSSRYFDADDGFTGINTAIWRFKAFICGSTGHIYYGGSQIIGRFHPDSLFENPDPPKVILTDLQVNYRPAVPGREKWFPSALSLSNELALPPFVKSFAIQFAALDFINPKNNRYAYRLEGFHDDWVYCGSQKQAAFTDLPSGEYLFHVKASNNDGVWNEEGTSIKIRILPPWYRSTFAWVLWIGLFIAAIYGAYRLQLNRARLRQQVRLEHDHAEKLAQLDHVKSNFFANVSHEFRTPLTLIQGPIEKLRSETGDKNLKSQYDMVLRNTRRLRNLINQLLDFSRIEGGRMTLDRRTVDIIRLTRAIVNSFQSLAERKNISLYFTSERRVLPVFIDQDKYEKIIGNLLSNAFKFTSSGGTVSVNLKMNTDQFIVRVKDTGIGIESDKLPYVFDRFYQADNSKTRHQEGTGIGLALTRELVGLHSGTIQVESEQNRGSVFSVRLPIGESLVRQDELEQSTIHACDVDFEQTDETESREQIDKRKSRPTILVVEDNQDVRTYIHDNLMSQFKTKQAKDGADGFEKALSIIPDLIISDVMMPELDGFALCEKLKTDERTSHIPVILLTARATDKDKLTGLETGADDYLIKPFNVIELQVRVTNLIENRRKLQQKYQPLSSDLKETDISSVDKKFMQRLMQIIEEFIADPEFDVEFLGQKIGMSRMTLFRKIKALTGLSVSDFIRTIRLKHAALLLQNKSGNISEIAFQVGFKNPAHFSDCFRKQFGQSPSRYVSEHVK